jgi:hypothetical protein
MSNQLIKVKFQDGTIMNGLYQTTADGLFDKLVNENEYINIKEISNNNYDCNCGKDEKVEIFNVSEKEYWQGTACKHCKIITSELNYFEDNYNNSSIFSKGVTKGIPVWYGI